MGLPRILSIIQSSSQDEPHFARFSHSDSRLDFNRERRQHSLGQCPTVSDATSISILPAEFTSSSYPALAQRFDPLSALPEVPISDIDRALRERGIYLGDLREILDEISVEHIQSVAAELARDALHDIHLKRGEALNSNLYHISRNIAARNLVIDEALTASLAERSRGFWESVGLEGDLKVFVYEGEAPNAFVLQGGAIMVSSSLVREFFIDGTGNFLNDRFTTVMSHELAHLYLNHSNLTGQLPRFIAIQQTAIYSQLENATEREQPLLVRKLLELKLASLYVQRQMENEAEILGIAFAERAGTNPEAYSQSLLDLEELYQDPRWNRPGQGLFDTHPSIAQRVALVECVETSQGSLP